MFDSIQRTPSAMSATEKWVTNRGIEVNWTSQVRGFIARYDTATLLWAAATTRSTPPLNDSRRPDAVATYSRSILYVWMP